MAKTTTAIRFGPQERGWIQVYASSLGISFSQFIREVALKKLEDAIDVQDYLRAVEEDDSARYTTDEVMRETLADK